MKKMLACFIGLLIASLSYAGPAKGFMLSTKKPLDELISDVQVLANSNATIVRFPIYFAYVPSPNWWLGRLGEVLKVTGPKNMTVVVDIHHPEAAEDSRINDVAGFVRNWERISTYTAKRSEKIWLDLLNEPKNSNWPDIALLAAKKVRSYDRTHPIVYACLGASSTRIRSLNPLPGISNQILTCHFWDAKWDPVVWRHAAYPNSTSGHDRTSLEADIKEIAAVRSRTGVPVYIGEVGVAVTDATTSQLVYAKTYLKDFTSLAEKYNIPVTVHAYKEAAIWDYTAVTDIWSMLKEWLNRR